MNSIGYVYRSDAEVEEIFRIDEDLFLPFARTEIDGVSVLVSPEIGRAHV